MRSAVVVALIAAVTYWWTSRAPPGDRGVSDAIAARMEDGAVVDLGEVAPFEWDRFCAFGPYTTETGAARELGFHWPYRWGSIEMRDDRNFLVFVNGNDVVAAFDHTRDRGDFDWEGETCFTREAARFDVSREGELTDGSPHHVLRAAS